MHLSPLSDDHVDCSLVGALRRMQFGLIATLIAIATAFVMRGLGI